jgi:hypothetical protein
VLKMLVRSPELSLTEARKESTQLTLMVKTLMDKHYARICGKPPSVVTRETRHFEQRQFHHLRDTIHEILLRIVHLPLTAEEAVEVRELLSHLTVSDRLYDQIWGLHDRLDSGPQGDRPLFPVGLQEAFARLQPMLDGLWLRVLFGEQAPETGLDTSVALQALEDAYFVSIREAPGYENEERAWMYDATSDLREIVLSLARIAESSVPSRKPGPGPGEQQPLQPESD